MRTYICALLASLIATAALATHNPPPISGTCETDATAYKQVPGSFSMAGTAAVAIPNAYVQITQGGTEPGCVILEFSSHTHGNGTNGADLWYDLDNGAEHEGQNYMRAVPVGPMAPHTAIFIIEGVPPGLRTIGMAILSTTSATLTVSAVRMLVRYKK